MIVGRVTVCDPLGWDRTRDRDRPRTVVQLLTGAIRMQRVHSTWERDAVKADWLNSDYSRWRREVRIFEERPC